MAPVLSRLGAGRGGFGFGRRATSPIYSIIPSVSSLNEGSPVTFTVNTINVQSGTTLYWTINSVSGTVNASDFNEGVSGSFVVSGNTGSVVLNVSNDATTEGSESFQLQVRTGSTSGPVVATSTTITIGDTSLNPTYSVSPSTTSVNEGSSVTFTTTTTNVPNSTTLYWTLSTISGTINSSDFSGGATSGSFTITSNSGSVVLTLANDTTTEGSESFQFQVRTGSTSGTVVATSATVTINDTSLTPLSATGGTVATPGNGYKYHTFTSPGSFVVSNVGPGTIEVIVVAGGGGGGYYQSGGGGAGGLAYNPTCSITATSYPVIIGGGGGDSSSGSNTTAFGITALGGGNGGARAPINVQAGPGGSGGGAGSQHPGIGAPGTQPSQPQPSGTLNYGNPGGGNSFPAGGGGGGAGAAGGNAGPATLSGKGGDGRQYPQFTGPLIGAPSLAPLSGYFAGGGSGAGEYVTDQPVQPGGAGGGGGGSAGTPGVTNSGGGGAGARGSTGGSGGSGIVVIRYTT